MPAPTQTPDANPAPVRLDKAATRIRGLDDMTQGGLPCGRANLLAGGPGCGKTVLALQTLVQAAANGESGMFVAFEEDSSRIVANVASFGWNLPELEKKSLFFLDAKLRPDVVCAGEFDLSGLLAGLKIKADQMGARRIVFDSIDVLLTLLDNPQAERRELFRLNDWLVSSGLTGIITCKNRDSGHSSLNYLDFMQYLVDCVIFLRHDLDNRVARRTLRIVKYRGSGFYAGEVALSLGDTGAEVVSFAQSPALQQASTERISSGVARLDSMLGGGYYRGSAVLLSGAPGTAKTTLSGAFLLAACQRGELSAHRTGIRCRDTQQKTIAWNSAQVRDGDGRLARLFLFGTDVSAQVLAEEQLRVAAVAFESQNGILITNPQGVIERVNSAFTRLTGFSAQEAVGQTPALLKSGRQDPLFYRRMWDALLNKGGWQGEIWNKRKNGEIYAEMLSITAIATPEQGITHFVGNFHDITASKAAEAEIHRLAYHDLLTELPSRRLLYDRLGQAVAATARSRLYGAIFFIDIDNFKALNDTRGHDVGDLLLTLVAQRLRLVVREGDTVARLGGDEFVVLLQNLSTGVREAAALARQLGDKLRLAIDPAFNLHGHDYRCRLSIGVGLFNAHDSVEDLFKRADLALYEAKSAGRNILRFFDPAMQAALDTRSAMEAELGEAIHSGQLLLFYQPQVDALSRVVGVEALLRWQHPQRGLVPPGEFIGLAEETGLILPIGLWVLQTACALLKSWERNALHVDLQIAVNVSARQFQQADFVAQVQGVLDDSAVNPARLKLELTESVVLQNVEDAIQKMTAIQQMGIRFSMDDFGTGYSSLSYLARLPIDQLKIDQSFVANLPGKSSDEAIARTIITLGRELSMQVIAEGVETEAQRLFLQKHGCHAYQGYLFSRPLRLEALDEFLKAHTPGRP